jgi:2-polyprenyl-3-methyl-5-hydroxy-6-metoxy-1,4-benzoquinol methylase
MTNINLVEVPCPQCGNQARRKLVQEGERAVVKCKNCDLMFTSPRFTDTARVEFLNNDYQPASFQEQYEATINTQHERVAKTLQFLGSKHGKWLDVGCAAGVLLSEAQRAAFTPCGFEVRFAYAEELRKRHGWDVRSSDTLANAGFDKQSFNVISVTDTLYYMPDPVSELRAMKTLLAPDGVLVCRVVNGAYLLFKNAGLLNYLRFGRWSNLNTEQYMIYFTSKTLRNMFKEAGLHIIREETGPAWMAGSSLNLIIKRCWYRIAKALLLFGINLGVSIDVWAVPDLT